jgi:hypothetical protein
MVRTILKSQINHYNRKQKPKQSEHKVIARFNLQKLN